jgi:hypothetical protein
MDLKELLAWLVECRAGGSELIIPPAEMPELEADVRAALPPPRREDPLLTRLKADLAARRARP